MATGMTEELISVRAAAKECGRNTETVRRWIWAGKLPAEKLGNQLFIKRSDFASFCRETAVRKYQAEAEPDFLERAIALREEVKARGVKPIDAGELIRKMRKERDSETILYGTGERSKSAKPRAGNGGKMEMETNKVANEYETQTGADFIERAIRFQNKLRARGYPEVDTVALVKKSRAGRMRELRQSLP